MDPSRLRRVGFSDFPPCQAADPTSCLVAAATGDSRMSSMDDRPPVRAAVSVLRNANNYVSSKAIHTTTCLLAQIVITEAVRSSRTP
ncbi:hypothetical protein CSAL01_03102 [Colletotrichum salicis]|uniref:Uncharacterized protein n=1 Tax=Colletotrichum salicis TaxID=1209931 RepID=A0A135UU01_9PEZI|nr:hypothetical protein CSAL01_03102 [Colletotrichum salicis]